MTPENLTTLIQRLEQAAAELGSPELSPERAAELVSQCAQLAGEASAELDRAVRQQESLAFAGRDQHGG